MDRFDLSRQDISSLTQVSDDIVRQVERGGDDEYALSFAQNRIIEVQDIGRFQHVGQLDLSSNKIVSLDGIQALQRLESINVSRNNLLSVDVLAKLPVLRVLNVSKNSIVQLDALKEHRELMVLDASFNNITKWPLFGAMNALESLDVSSNLLEAFSPTSVPLFFPENLCRLSISKNQIHEMCGIGSLGMHLPKLQSLNVEGNPAVTQLQRSGGKLEYLLANFFPSLTPNVEECSDPLARSKSEAFAVPRVTLVTMQQALQQGKEEMLVEFLRTGAVPQQSELPIPMARKAIVESTIEPNRFKVEELVPPAPPQPAIVSTAAHAATADVNDSNPALAVSSTALSKENKMKMWKRIQEERKAQQGKEKGRLQREMLAEQSSSQGLDQTRANAS
uniref:U2A'/phosphoprotein 32 family A C-terminal domain-containing protein n=1 Tax=Globisporangium ultimum (strain ATCC 200006 / CBS 805.95 / DAOM BR144) TaxID=431595 RepID=K3X7T1_GLOUD